MVDKHPPYVMAVSITYSKATIKKRLDMATLILLCKHFFLVFSPGVLEIEGVPTSLAITKEKKWKSK